MDTTEVFEAGAVNAEAHVGTGQTGPAGAEVVLGAGFGERVSGVITASGPLDGTVPWQPRLGVLGSVLRSAHLDVDAGLDTDGASLGGLVEINLDADAHMASVGGWLLLSGSVSGELHAAPGAYWSFSEGRQILLQWRADLAPRSRDASIALGFNATLGDRLEVVTEIDLPPEDGLQAASWSAGVIATF